MRESLSLLSFSLRPSCIPRQAAIPTLQEIRAGVGGRHGAVAGSGSHRCLGQQSVFGNEGAFLRQLPPAEDGRGSQRAASLRSRIQVGCALVPRMRRLALGCSDVRNLGFLISLQFFPLESAGQNLFRALPMHRIASVAIAENAAREHRRKYN